MFEVRHGRCLGLYSTILHPSIAESLRNWLYVVQDKESCDLSVQNLFFKKKYHRYRDYRKHIYWKIMFCKEMWGTILLDRCWMSCMMIWSACSSLVLQCCRVVSVVLLKVGCGSTEWITSDVCMVVPCHGECSRQLSSSGF